jgi:hypothetical protein
MYADRQHTRESFIISSFTHLHQLQCRLQRQHHSHVQQLGLSVRVLRPVLHAAVVEWEAPVVARRATAQDVMRGRPVCPRLGDGDTAYRVPRCTVRCTRRFRRDAGAGSIPVYDIDRTAWTRHTRAARWHGPRRRSAWQAPTPTGRAAAGARGRGHGIPLRPVYRADTRGASAIAIGPRTRSSD